MVVSLRYLAVKFKIERSVLRNQSIFLAKLHNTTDSERVFRETTISQLGVATIYVKNKWILSLKVFENYLEHVALSSLQRIPFKIDNYNPWGFISYEKPE